MFTGIVAGQGEIKTCEQMPGLLRYMVILPPDLSQNLKIGASIAIDGVCQTIMCIDNNTVGFEAIEETLNKTTLKTLKPGQKVNLERAAKIGDEIGGHNVSGHVFGTGTIANISHPTEYNTTFTIHCNPKWMKYILPKGFIAIDGASLTIAETNPKGSFTLHLIPETLKITGFSTKNPGDLVNIELDSQTQIIVDTVERLLRPTDHD